MFEDLLLLHKVYTFLEPISFYGKAGQLSLVAPEIALTVTSNCNNEMVLV